MKKHLLIAGALALLASLTVTYGAGTTANASWTAPTTYTDGSALPASQIAHYTITWAPASGQLGPSGSQTVPGTATSATVPVACGSVTFTVSVTTTSGATYPNATSGQSNAVPYATGVSCAPNPPTGLVVQ